MQRLQMPQKTWNALAFQMYFKEKAWILSQAYTSSRPF